MHVEIFRAKSDFFYSMSFNSSCIQENVFKWVRLSDNCQVLVYRHFLTIGSTTAINFTLYTQEESYSGSRAWAIEIYTTVTLLSTLMSQRWQLSLVWYRWQWQYCDSGVLNCAVTAVAQTVL